MTLTTKQQATILIVCTASGVAVGRFTVPVKVVTQVKTVEVEKKQQKTDITSNRQLHRKRTTVEVKKPDGTTEITTTVITDSGDKINASSEQKSSEDKQSESKKETVKDSGHLNLSVLVGANPFNLSQGMVYGGHVTRDIFGPVNIGVWGLSNGTFGLSGGLTF